MADANDTTTDPSGDSRSIPIGLIAAEAGKAVGGVINKHLPGTGPIISLAADTIGGLIDKIAQPPPGGMAPGGPPPMPAGPPGGDVDPGDAGGDDGGDGGDGGDAADPGDAPPASAGNSLKTRSRKPRRGRSRSTLESAVATDEASGGPTPAEES